MTTEQNFDAAGAALLIASLIAISFTSACASTPASIIEGPVSAAPVLPPRFIERPVNGAIFQAGMVPSTLYSSERRPQAIGDTLKVEIAEKLEANQTQSTDTARDNKVAVKGPGGAKPGSVFAGIVNADANASSSDAFKGQGTAQAKSTFTASLAVSVVNVLPNGHLVVAGEKSSSLGGGVSTLRFSGVVDPRTLKSGNVVSSTDVASARLENVSAGDVSEASTRSWLQRVLARNLAVW